MRQETLLTSQFVCAARRPVDSTSGGTTTESKFGWSSSNWSGYAISSNTPGAYDSVSAEWNVPAVSAPAPTQPTSIWARLMRWFKSLFGGVSSSSDAYSAIWIGIDGFNDNSLIQTGTAQNVVGGKAEYYAWWEILPNPESNIDPKQYPVTAGDRMVATINQQTNGNWSISMGNRSKGWVFQKTDIPYSGPQTSADWIVEAPMLNGQMTTLADYGTVTFTNCSINGTDPHLKVSEAGVMVQSGQRVSTPSAPGPNGDSFVVQYGSNQPNPPA